MIRTRTTLIVGAGASCELQLPSGQELLARIGQAYDFSRFDAGVQTRDSVLLAQYVTKLKSRQGIGDEGLRAATDRIRTACKLGRSIDQVIDQHDNDPMIVACGKLAITHFICQAEAKSTLRATPRVEGDLPVQGEDNWLYQLGQLVTSGVSRSKVERCFDNLSIIAFNYDRSIEHFMPWAMVMAFGMPLKEAQQIVMAKLKVIHPYGTIGRLPWQGGEGPEVEWGVEQPWNIHNLFPQIKTAAEQARDLQTTKAIQMELSAAKRIVFLGFGFHPQNIEILIDYSLSHNPEVIATTLGLGSANVTSVTNVLKRKSGIESDELLTIKNSRCAELLRDMSLLLES